MRDLQRLRLAQKPRAHCVPVALGAAPQHPDRDGMSERAMRALEDFAAQPSRTDPAAQVVRAEQPGAGDHRGDPAHS